jgi:hypothetical protein
MREGIHSLDRGRPQKTGFAGGRKSKLDQSFLPEPELSPCTRLMALPKVCSPGEPASHPTSIEEMHRMLDKLVLGRPPVRPQSPGPAPLADLEVEEK